jgi:ABC-2 type transport system ATP-binding protein
MIEVQNLTKYYGPMTAIRDVSFSVAPGQIVGFLGPNGAGKSTTMRILACFMPASSGTARVAGFDVFRESMEVRRRIGYLPENVPLYSDMRVRPYLDFVAELKGVPRGSRRARVAEVLERCKIGDVQGRLIGTLSKGYRQRVGLAQALVSDPHVLILDEPTIGLDPQQIAEIRGLIKSLAGEHTVILSTHILPEVSMVCSGVVIINKGAIVAHGGIDSLVEQFFPTSRVEVEIAPPTPAVANGLRTIPGVMRVSEQPTGPDDVVRFVVESPRGRDVRAEIFQMAAQQRWVLREMRQVGMTLEEVFIRIVAGEEDASAGPGAPAAGPDEGDTASPAEAKTAGAGEAEA